MRPKGKLFALLAVFAAIGLVTATGAFTTVQAQRTATIAAAGDDAALLRFNASSQYATIDSSSGELTIDLTSPGSASGLNPDATTVFAELFRVENQGSQSVQLDIQITSSHSSPWNTVELYNASSGASVTTFSEDLGAGEESSGIGLRIVVGQVSDISNLGNLQVTITVEADQTDGYQG